MLTIDTHSISLTHNRTQSQWHTHSQTQTLAVTYKQSNTNSQTQTKLHTRTRQANKTPNHQTADQIQLALTQSKKEKVRTDNLSCFCHRWPWLRYSFGRVCNASHQHNWKRANLTRLPTRQTVHTRCSTSCPWNWLRQSTRRTWLATEVGRATTSTWARSNDTKHSTKHSSHSISSQLRIAGYTRHSWAAKDTERGNAYHEQTARGVTCLWQNGPDQKAGPLSRPFGFWISASLAADMKACKKKEWSRTMAAWWVGM